MEYSFKLKDGIQLKERGFALLTKILVVDDSATDRFIIKNMLSEYCVLTACDGVEAIRILEEHEGIKLLILDLNMPNMDGFQVLRFLKENKRYEKLRTIILTNYGYLYSQNLIKKAAEALSQHSTDNRILFYPGEHRFVFYLFDYKDKNELIDFSSAIAETLESLFVTDRIGGGIGILELEQNSNEIDIDLLLKNLIIASERSINLYGKNFQICFYNEELEVLVTRERDIIEVLNVIAADDNINIIASNDNLDKFPNDNNNNITVAEYSDNTTSTGNIGNIFCNDSIDNNTIGNFKTAYDANNSLFLQFQPVLDIRTGFISGFEALARIRTEKLGLVSPLEFIPIAEKTKLIIPIGEKVFVKAFSFLKKLKKYGYDDIIVSINVSIIQLLSPDFTNRLFKLINDMQIEPRNICIEITESIFASEYDNINKIIEELRDAGFHIAIDDFGTGYSSLAREKELKVDCMKIHKCFIDNLLCCDLNKAITSDIISIAHKLGHYTVAEGVEHHIQFEYLKKHNCDRIQGYLISKPLDEEEAIRFLSNYNKNITSISG